MVRPTSAISEDVLHVRTTDVWMGVVSTKSPNGVKRGGFLGLLLALFGPRAMSDLSPDCAPKRMSASATGTLRKLTEMTDPDPNPFANCHVIVCCGPL
jgi:hypothetical protein